MFCVVNCWFLLGTLFYPSDNSGNLFLFHLYTYFILCGLFDFLDVAQYREWNNEVNKHKHKVLFEHVQGFIFTLFIFYDFLFDFQTML